MRLRRFIDIDGKRYLWRDLVQLRRAQATPKQEQPTLFPLREDCRPAGERSAAERYQRQACSPRWSATAEPTASLDLLIQSARQSSYPRELPKSIRKELLTWVRGPETHAWNS